MTTIDVTADIVIRATLNNMILDVSTVMHVMTAVKATGVVDVLPLMVVNAVAGAWIAHAVTQHECPTQVRETASRGRRGTSPVGSRRTSTMRCGSYV